MKEIDYSNCFKMWAEHSYEVYDLTRYTQGGSVKFERNIEYKETESSERVKLHEISHYSYEPHFSCWGFSVSLWFRPLIPGLWKERDVSTQAEASLPRLSSIAVPLDVFYLNEGYYLDSAIHPMAPEKKSCRFCCCSCLVTP